MLARASFKPRKQNSMKADSWKRCEPFLKWIRGRPCFLHDRGGCDGKIIAAHFDPWGNKGIGTKVSDQAALPLCGGFHGHHDEQHRIGWQSFQRKYAFDGRDVVTAYWLEWLDRTPMGRAWAERHET